MPAGGEAERTKRRSAGQARRPRPRAARSPASWEPYLVPYAAFLLILQAGAWLPEPLQPAVLPVQVVVPLGLLIFYAARGSFPELRGYRPQLWELALDIGAGTAIAAVWVGPFVIGGGLSRPPASYAFDPDALGEGLRGVNLALRLAGFALVTPFVEELFVRSFLIRGAELVSVSRHGVRLDEQRDFRDLPIGRFTLWSFAVTVLYFTFSHVSWEWPVALPAGILFNLWLYVRKQIPALVVAHAAANGSVFALAWLGSRAGHDFWFFL